MKKFLKLSLIALLMVSIAVVSGCGSNKEAAKNDKKILKVATEAAYAPFEFKDKDGNITGFDAEYITAIAKEMGYEAKLTHTAWDGLIPSLNSGEADVVISARTITEERKAGELFSDPYLNVTQTVALREGTTIKTLNDLKGKKIAVQNNTTGHYWAAKLYNVKPEEDFDKIKKAETTPDALSALKNGEVDAVVADRPVVLAYIKANPNAKIVKFDSKEFEAEYYGISMKLGNSELADKVNAAIKKLKENGTYDKLVKKYFPE